MRELGKLPRGSSTIRRWKKFELGDEGRKDVFYIIAGILVLLGGPALEYFFVTPQETGPALRAGLGGTGSVFDEPSLVFDAEGDPLLPSELTGRERGRVVPIHDMGSLAYANRLESVLRANFGSANKVEGGPAGKARKKKLSKGGWKEAVDTFKSAARRGTRRGARTGSIRPKAGTLQGKLRGLASLTGARHGFKSSISVQRPKLSAPSSARLMGSPQARKSLTRIEKTPDYRSAGARSLAAGTGRIAALEKAALEAGEFFDQSDTGVSGGAAPDGPSASEGFLSPSLQRVSGDGEETKPSANPGNETMRQTQDLKEDLRETKKKMEMQKELELKWAKKEYNELGRKKMMEQMMMQTACQAFVVVLGAALGG